MSFHLYKDIRKKNTQEMRIKIFFIEGNMGLQKTRNKSYKKQKKNTVKKQLNNGKKFKKETKNPKNFQKK